LLLNQPTTVNGVPGTGTKGVGVGGLITAGGYGGIRFSLQGSPWTPKTATFIQYVVQSSSELVPQIAVLKGFAHAPVSTTTSTAQPSGVVQLVTPITVVSNLPKEPLILPAAMVLRIHFIPEPGLLLLLGSGVGGVALLGRRHMRK
jgi:hypothetical protein